MLDTRRNLSHEEWLLKFINELIRLRPHTPLRFVRIAASQCYGSGTERPEEAAIRFHLHDGSKADRLPTV